jgi:predicted CXXCH cytochrome family protein
MAALDPAQEPPDAAFDHPLSERRYEIRRKDGRLWHSEFLHSPGTQEVVLAEYPIQYVIGSGRHVRMYAVEVDGFLVESPVSWYASRQAWGISPGYDTVDQPGFARPIPDRCLYCHAGQSEAVGASMHRIAVSEAAIGCERCHGPGSLHVARQEARQESADKLPGGTDTTIVNPTRLPRDLAEAVCQQCHLRTRATVVTRGRKEADYRPGLPLQDFRQEYVLDTPDRPMTIVGHVEQMHRSRCYQAAETFSCLTCHDPHDSCRTRRPDEHYDAICKGCHQPQQCTVSEQRRHQESPENNCIHCHMPRTPTEVPHVAFTNHRVGIFSEPPAGAQGAVPEEPHLGLLRPFLDDSGQSDIDRKRSLGLAYLDQSTRPDDVSEVVYYQQRSLKLMSEVQASGLQDAVLDASLARVRSQLNLDGALQDAERALALPDLVGQDRCVALYSVAYARAKEGRYAEAMTALDELTGLRRHEADWLLRADCERGLGHAAEAAEALAMACRINSRLWEVHRHLANYYRQQGDVERAAWHQQRAVP